MWTGPNDFCLDTAVCCQKACNADKLLFYNSLKAQYCSQVQDEHEEDEQVNGDLLRVETLPALNSKLLLMEIVSKEDSFLSFFGNGGSSLERDSKSGN